MRKLAGPLMMLAGCWLLLPAALAQETVGGIIYSRHRHFRIPFQTTPGQKLKQLNLYVSSDQGKTWHSSTTAAPADGHFRFLAERDGYYWFAVQTLETDGRASPATMDQAQPNLKVVIDTQAPAVQVQPLSPRGSEVGVAWDVRDDNLDLSLADSLRLEYRPAGGQWYSLPVHPGSNQHYWNPQSAGAIEVRVRARDRAGNWGEATTSVSLAGSSHGGNPGHPHVGGVGRAADGPGPGEERRFVNSKRITLNYDVKDVGPSGVSAVDLWYTVDGRTWNKYPRSADEAPQKALVLEVSSEGIYGLTLVAKSGVGLSVRAPQAGDRPQMWVEVDMTKPVVQLYNVIVGQGEDKGKLTVTWSARDRNLAKQPITLSYAEQASGPWTPLAKDLANSGRYVWTMPAQVPYQFYVKVEAADLAGNVGDAVTDALVKVDLSQPRAKIVNVGPASP